MIVPNEVPVPEVCTQPPSFLHPTHAVFVTLSNSLLVGNVANSSHSSGGGLFYGPGGALALINTTCVGNSATLFGGGVALGTGFLQQGSCSLLASGCIFAGNVAASGGSQVRVVLCRSAVNLVDARYAAHTVKSVQGSR